LSSGGQADALLAVDGVLHSVLLPMGVPNYRPAEATLHILAVGAQQLPVSGALHIQEDGAPHLLADAHEVLQPTEDEDGRKEERKEKLTALPSIPLLNRGSSRPTN